MLVKIGSLYLTLGTFTYEAGFTGRVHINGKSFELSAEDTAEIERILDEAIAAQKTVEQIVAEQRAQSEELQKRAENLQQREQYIEGIALQAQQIVNASQQNKSAIVSPAGAIPMPGFGVRKKR